MRILIAARWPEKIAEFMVEKEIQLDGPLMRRFLLAMGELLDGDGDSEIRPGEIADAVVEMAEQAAARGELDRQDEQMPAGAFVDLLDTVVLAAGPRMVRLRDRLQGLMVERGWTGLVKMEGVHQCGVDSHPA